MPASQAGRRGFDPRLPLQLLKLAQLHAANPLGLGQTERFNVPAASTQQNSRRAQSISMSLWYSERNGQQIWRIGIPPPRRSILTWRREKRFRRRNYAEAQTWEEQFGSFSPRVGLHGNELRLRSAQRQAGDDPRDQVGGRTRRHILRHGRRVGSFHERGSSGG